MKWHAVTNIAARRWSILVLALVLGAFICFRPAWAQQSVTPNPLDLIRSFSCVVPGYGVASIISDPTLDNLALAERVPGNNQLVIYVRTDLMNKFAPTTRVFWLEHECSHHRLGHTKSSGFVPDVYIARQEDAADCAAVQAMVNAPTPMIDEDGLNIIEQDLVRIPKDNRDDIYKSGAQRAQQVDRCAHDDAWAQTVINAGNCAAQ